MSKLKNIIIVVAVLLTLGIAWKLFRKVKDTDKLKIGDTSLKPTKEIKKFTDLAEIFSSGLKVKGFIEIRNFSGRDYTLSQLNIDCFTPKTETLLAEQTNIIEKNIVLKAKQTTNIPLEYTVNIVNALLMFKESEVLPADATVWQVISQPAQYWKEINMKKLTMKLKGFIVAEGINLSINMDYPLYD